MKVLKTLIAVLLSVLLGLIFLYSGYTKLDPVIETFEFTFIDIGVANWYTAPVIARLLIGFEFFLGALLILNYNLRKFTLPLTVSLLLFFIVYLIVQIITSGNNGNCGCFGEHLRMTPLQAILKNIVMIVLAAVVYFLYNGWKIDYNKLFLSLIGVTVCLVPFIVNPIDYTYTSNNQDEKVNYPLELNLLFEPADSSKVEVPKVELRKGKHVVAFLSLTCSHCRIAAKKFRLIKKNNPELPIYFVLNGDKSNYKAFIEDTKADNIPNSFCLGKSFVQLASAHLPRIYYLDNGIVVKKLDYFELNQYAIENWVHTGNPN
ncbi:MAG: DoxX family protein [Bacteroidia bacterium]|nr:DoxX family protein [Bacteroidia bacterium]